MAGGYRPVESYQHAQNGLMASFARQKRIFLICGAFLILTLFWGLSAVIPSHPKPITNIPSSNTRPPNAPATEPAWGIGKDGKPQNIAAIVETRAMTNLVPLILHFSTVLGSEWPIAFFTDLKPTDFKPRSSAFEKAIAQGRIRLFPLPKDSKFTNHDSVSLFLTTPWFWEQLAPAPHVLIFQADSIICANAPSSIDDYTKFDFIGAPISPDLGHGDVGMNGGLSLRNRTLVLDIIKKYNWKGELDAMKPEEQTPKEKYEDQWLYQKMIKVGGRLPSQEEAKRFSVESMWYEEPLGYHQISRWNAGVDRIKVIEKYCPEYGLATGDLIVD